MTHPLRIAGWGLAALLLTLPLVAMQFTDEVKWTLSDFVFAGVMFGGVGGLLELTVRRSPSPAYRGGVAIALLAAFLLVWINAAVGIIGDENNPLNLVYFVTILLALAGAIGAGFQPRGMARAMLIAAATFPPIVWIAAPAAAGPHGLAGFAALNAGFATLFLAAAWLFRRAALSARS